MQYVAIPSDIEDLIGLDSDDGGNDGETELV